METANTNASPTADREIVISRVINAPRELVFEAWRKPEHLAQWWGPNGFTTTTSESSIRPGGRWKFMMHGPDGKDYPNLVVYKEVKFPELITYSNVPEDDPENEHFNSIVTFDTAGNGKTKVTMRVVLPSKEALERAIREVGAKEGGEQTISRMAAYVESLS